MNTKKVFTIGEPCHEDWQSMTPTEKGRFCDACAKCVVDLRGKTQTEIKNLYVEHEGNLCGSMSPNQFVQSRRESQLSVVEANQALLGKSRGLKHLSIRRLQIFAASFVAAFGLFLNSSLHAQKRPPVRGKIAMPSAGSASGVVLKDGKPLAKVVVIARSDHESLSATSDEAGRFFFHDLTPGDWTFYANHEWYHGSALRTITLGGREEIQLRMEEEMVLGDIAPIDWSEQPIQEIHEEEELEPLLEKPREPIQTEPHDPEQDWNDLSPELEAEMMALLEKLESQNLEPEQLGAFMAEVEKVMVSHGRADLYQHMLEILDPEVPEEVEYAPVDGGLMMVEIEEAPVAEPVEGELPPVAHDIDPGYPSTEVSEPLIIDQPVRDECKCLEDEMEIIDLSSISPISALSNEPTVEPSQGVDTEVPSGESFELSPTDLFDVTVKPVPTRSDITIRIENSPNLENIELLLFSADGKLVKTGKMSGATGAITRMDITDLPAGIYFLKGLQNDYVFEKKVLKL